jgi:hypothetical protein
MENITLKNAINDSIAANSGYLSSFFIGPTGGIGDLWTDRFDQFSSMILQSYYFGESAHGPLVTIDPVYLTNTFAWAQKYHGTHLRRRKSMNGRSDT